MTIVVKKILGKNAEVFMKKNMTDDKKPEILQDVFFDRKNTTLSLRKKMFVIAIDPTKIKEFLFYHSTALSVLMFTLLFIGIASVSLTSKASIAHFYPQSCLGGWKNTHNAEGEPDVPLGSDQEAFHNNNSAFLRNANAELYCGSFGGEIPADTSPKTFTLKLSWSIDDGSVLHDESDILETDSEPPAVENTDTPEVQADEVIETIEVIEAQSEAIPENIPEESVEEEMSEEAIPEADTPVEVPETVKRNIFLSMIKKAFAEEVVESADEPQQEEVSEPVDEPTQDVVIEAVDETVEEPISEIPEEPRIPERGGDENMLPSDILIDAQGVDDEGLIQEDADTASQTDNNEESTVVSASPELLEVLFSTDGTNWKKIGTASYESWQNEIFALPLNKWTDLHTIQIALRPIPSLDEPPVIYVDSMYIAVEYDDTTLDRGIQPNFFADELIYDETFETIRIIKIRRNDVVELWYSDLTEASFTPEIPIEAIEEKSKEFFDSTDDAGTLIEIENIQPSASTVEIIEIANSEEEVSSSDQEEILISDEAIVDTESVSIEDTVVPPPDADQVVQSVYKKVALAEPIVFTKNEDGPEIIEAKDATIVPTFELTQDIRLGLVGSLPTRRALSSSEKESAGTLFWHLVTAGSMVDDESPVVYKEDQLYWLSDDHTMVYRFNIPQQQLLSEYFDINRFIVDLRAFDKIDTFEELATHTCSVIPFSLSLASDSETQIEVVLSQHALGAGFTIETGGIPEGLSVLFEKDASSKMTTGQQSTVYIPGTVSVAPTVPGGSYTIVVIVSELYTGQMLPNFCQMNVVVNSAT